MKIFLSHKIYISVISFLIILSCLFTFDTLVTKGLLFAQEISDENTPKAKAGLPEKADTPKRKSAGWFYKWFPFFSRETGLVNVVSLPKEMMETLNLDDCIKIAVKNNLQLQIAEKTVNLSEMRLLEARRNLLPKSDIVYEESTGRVSGRRYAGRKQYVELQQPVFHGGELYYTMKQAETNLEVVKTDYGRIKNDLILQVKKAYYTVGRAKENLTLQNALKTEVDKIFDMVNKAFEEGVISKLEQLNVASQTSQVGYQLASAEGDLDVAELMLKQAMNVEPKENIKVEPKMEFKKVDIEFEKALTAAFINRPEMKINSLTLRYYRYEKDIAKSKGWPKIDLMGNWGLAREEFIPEDNAWDVTGPAPLGAPGPDRKLHQQWYAGVKASMPFWGSTGEYSWTREQWVPVVSAFQGTEATTNSYKLNFLDNLKYYSDKQSADIDLDRARQEFNKTKQDVTLEIREGCFNYEKAVIQLKTASDKVKYQDADLEFNKAKRGMGEADDSNVVESMIKLAQEKFGYTQALVDYYIAVASINKAIGIADYYKIDSEEGTVLSNL